MSIQNLQANGALLGTQPQRTALFHWNCAGIGRAALKQQSLSGPGPILPLSPQNKDNSARVWVPNISGMSRVGKNDLKYALQAF